MSAANEMRTPQERLFPDILSMATQKSTWYVGFNRVDSIKREGEAMAKDGTYASLMSYQHVETTLHRKIEPTNCRDTTPIAILVTLW